MSNKISGVDTRTGPVGAGRAVERAWDGATGTKTESGPSDVHITGSARALADLEQLVKDMPAVDEARVAAIASAIEQGTYKVVPEQIADALMYLEQALAPLGEKK